MTGQRGEFAQEGSDEQARRCRALAEEVHAEVCERGFDRELNSFVQAYGNKRLDASLLLIPLVGFLPATDPRVQGTLHAIEDKLLIATNSSSATKQKMPTMACLRAREHFWHAAFGSSTITYCRAATRKRGALFDRLLARCNDVGLLAEEFDPAAGRMLGNFPQAYSHVGLINCGLNLSRGDEPDRRTHRPSAPTP